MKALILIAICVCAATFLYLNQSTQPIDKPSTHAVGVENHSADNADPKTLVSEKKESSKETGAAEKSLEERYRLSSNNDIFPTLASRLEAIEARRPDLEITPEQVVLAIEKDHAWTPKTSKDPGIFSEKLSDQQIYDGREFIDFDPLKVETLMPGDHLDFTLDSAAVNFDVEIDDVKDFGDGNLMWIGTIENGGDQGFVTITQSSEVTLASVVIENADYELQSFGQDGWIADSRTMFYEHADNHVHPDGIDDHPHSHE